VLKVINVGIPPLAGSVRGKPCSYIKFLVKNSFSTSLSTIAPTDPRRTSNCRMMVNRDFLSFQKL
jgi:hypothetical protein